MGEMTMVERVARAIWRTRENQFPERVRRPEPDTFDNASGAWDVVLEQARAAIEAMREPIEEMTIAALMASDEHLAPTVEKFAAVHGFNTGAAIRVSTGDGRLWNVAYSAMIDAALKE